MYWIGPGRYTAERSRAFSIYGTLLVLVAGVVVGVSWFTTGGLTLAGVENMIWILGFAAALGVYVAYDYLVRRSATARRGPDQQGIVTGPNVMHAVYTPVGPPPTGVPAHPSSYPAYPPAPALGWSEPPGIPPLAPASGLGTPVVVDHQPAPPQQT